MAVTHLGSVDVNNARSSYDLERGLLLEVPTGEYDQETGRMKPGKTLRLRVNLKNSTVRLE